MTRRLELKAPTVASLDDCREAQSAMFQELRKYNLTTELIRGSDYFKDTEVGGIQYYSPNDEEWGCVIAVDYVNELAVDTGFFETADFEDITYGDEILESDYRMVFHDGKLMCKFSSE